MYLIFNWRIHRKFCESLYNISVYWPSACIATMFCLINAGMELGKGRDFVWGLLSISSVHYEDGYLMAAGLNVGLLGYNKTWVFSTSIQYVKLRPFRHTPLRWGHFFLLTTPELGISMVSLVTLHLKTWTSQIGRKHWYHLSNADDGALKYSMPFICHF